MGRLTARDRADRFTAAWERHYDAVLGYARRRTSPEAADEVAAETFAVLWRRLEEAPEDLLPWLIGVARGTLANRRRTERRRQALRRRLLSSAPLRAPDHADAVADDDALREAFVRLSAHDREILMLVAWDGLSHERAASVEGCSARTFTARLFRARRRLDAHLSGSELAGAHADGPTPEGGSR